jgi:ferredoxin
MKKVTIQPGCISCTTCVFYAPQVFEVTVTSEVKPNVALAEHVEAIRLAAAACPVNVITYQEE